MVQKSQKNTPFGCVVLNPCSKYWDKLPTSKGASGNQVAGAGARAQGDDRREAAWPLLCGALTNLLAPTYALKP